MEEQMKEDNRKYLSLTDLYYGDDIRLFMDDRELTEDDELFDGPDFHKIIDCVYKCIISENWHGNTHRDGIGWKILDINGKKLRIQFYIVGVRDFYRDLDEADISSSDRYPSEDDEVAEIARVDLFIWDRIDIKYI